MAKHRFSFSATAFNLLAFTQTVDFEELEWEQMKT